MIQPNTKKRYKILLILNTIAFFAMALVNYLSIALPLNGLENEVITDLYPNLFAPAGFAFSIWGPIYLLLGFYVIYQAKDLFSSSKEQLSSVNRIGFLFSLSSLFNISWIFAWHYLQVGLSLLCMILLLMTLLLLYQSLNSERGHRGLGEGVTHLAFSLYVGWITIALVANVTVFLVSIGWGGLGLSEIFWMAFITILATLIILSFLLRYRDWVFSLVGVWALWGILSKRLAADPVENTVVAVVLICLLFLLGGSIAMMIKNRREHHQLLLY